MQKTITLAIRSDIYDKVVKWAEDDNRSISNYLETALMKREEIMDTMTKRALESSIAHNVREIGNLLWLCELLEQPEDPVWHPARGEFMTKAEINEALGPKKDAAMLLLQWRRAEAATVPQPDLLGVWMHDHECFTAATYIGGKDGDEFTLTREQDGKREVISRVRAPGVSEYRFLIMDGGNLVAVTAD